jgi:hypothetical protein
MPSSETPFYDAITAMDKLTTLHLRRILYSPIDLLVFSVTPLLLRNDSWPNSFSFRFIPTEAICVFDFILYLTVIRSMCSSVVGIFLFASPFVPTLLVL